MKRLVRRFDRWLARRLGVYEFCDDAECILRLRLIHASRLLLLDGVQILKGAPLVELHLWNEHVPPIAKGGPGLAFGVLGGRLLMKSLHLVAAEIEVDPQLSGVQALVGVTDLIGTGATTGAEKLFRRLGFTLLPYHNPLGKFGEFWENLYGWALMWAYNDSSLRYRRFTHFHRTELWMPVQKFLQNFGGEGVDGLWKQI